MGIIFKSDYFEIYVFGKDHKPAHFHVYFPRKANPKGFVKVEIETDQIIEIENVSRKKLKQLESFLTEERKEMLKKEWEAFHGKI